MVAQQAPAPTWLGQAKFRSQTMGAITADAGQNIPRPFDLPQIGYLESLDLSTLLTFTFSTAPTGLDAFGAVAASLARVTVFVNSIGNLCDVSGFSLGFISAIEFAYRYGASALMPFPSATVAFGSVGTTAKTNSYHHRIPLGLYLLNFPFPIGLFQTALQNLSVRLIVRWLPIQGTAGNPGSGTYTGGVVGSQQSGQVQINESYFDPIQAPTAQPYLGFIHRWSEFQTSLNKAGDTDILLPGQNYYSRILYEIVSGGAGALALDSTHLQRLRLMYGANLAPFDEDETNQEVTQRMQRQYPGLVASMNGVPQGAGNAGASTLGVYWHDWVADTHDNRDWINAAATTNLRSRLTMAATGTYTGGGYINAVTEEIAPLALPAGAVVQGQAPPV